MKRTFITAATLAALATPFAGHAEDSRIAPLCGAGHVNELATQSGVKANPDGFYVVNLREQISHGDARIIVSDADGFYLCTRSAATPDMDTNKAMLLMNERTVKYLFVPNCPSKSGVSS